MTNLTLRSVKKAYGALEIIKGINLDIDSGEFVVFVGPSGCGKSTLLRMIAGLEDITAGSLDIGGQRMNDVDPSKRGISMVFQSYALYPHLTVRQNLGFAQRFAGVPKAEIEKQVATAARILELDKLLDRKPGALSGGQRQRVAIGRAIVRNPKVFLFDEPLSNLDAELRVHMRIEIARLHHEMKTTMIYVTHDQVEAMTLADKIVVLRAGIVEQVGAPLTLYDDPDNQFVAGFIGSPKMNFLKGVVEAGNGANPSIRLPEFGNSLIEVALKQDHIRPGESVTVGIRPEHFDATGSAQIEASVDALEQLGSDTFIYTKYGAGVMACIKAPGGRGLKVGDKIAARFDPAKALLFDAGGARRR
ncbi:ABC transporter ATP-binding protein [Pararhizobium sp.]|uniref:ABC transporter ATP-binding protein n=1 Tax=Pararhizobium sp. TaxID=1977563 RepID=UPI00271FD079|nr:sn-glycerol-3-phosphate ABC transporter ATP-binding protein UgpC [Pararhizobium sp.]MDO9415059.1 sn-glycerol-3-phosphate ABC transporter ATP-binding protein UgpC [Pararhizobium sp.]